MEYLNFTYVLDFLFLPNFSIQFNKLRSTYHSSLNELHYNYLLCDAFYFDYYSYIFIFHFIFIWFILCKHFVSYCSRFYIFNNQFYSTDNARKFLFLSCFLPRLIFRYHKSHKLHTVREISDFAFPLSCRLWDNIYSSSFLISQHFWKLFRIYFTRHIKINNILKIIQLKFDKREATVFGIL